jgi:hypothetical protein
MLGTDAGKSRCETHIELKRTDSSHMLRQFDLSRLTYVKGKAHNIDITAWWRSRQSKHSEAAVEYTRTESSPSCHTKLFWSSPSTGDLDIWLYVPEFLTSTDFFFEVRGYFTTDCQPVSQYVLVSSTLMVFATRYYFLSECFCLKFASLFLWGALSDERTGLQFAV